MMSIESSDTLERFCNMSSTTSAKRRTLFGRANMMPVCTLHREMVVCESTPINIHKMQSRLLLRLVGVGMRSDLVGSLLCILCKLGPQ